MDLLSMRGCQIFIILCLLSLSVAGIYLILVYGNDGRVMNLPDVTDKGEVSAGEFSQTKTSSRSKVEWDGSLWRSPDTIREIEAENTDIRDRPENDIIIVDWVGEAGKSFAVTTKDATE